MSNQQAVPMPNTRAHEEELSASCKAITAATINMMVDALTAAEGKVASADPLHAERYLHLADKLSDIATRMYALGERARERTGG
jgi:hypothetical protein